MKASLDHPARDLPHLLAQRRGQQADGLEGPPRQKKPLRALEDGISLVPHTLRSGSCAKKSATSKQTSSGCGDYESARECGERDSRSRAVPAETARASAASRLRARAGPEYHAFEQRDARQRCRSRPTCHRRNRIPRLIVEQTREFSDVRGGAAPAVGANYIHSELPSSLVRPARA